MINAIGLQNMGVRAFVEEKLPKLRTMKGAVVIANVFGYYGGGLPGGDPDAERRRRYRDVRAECELPEYEPWRNGFRD